MIWVLFQRFDGKRDFINVVDINDEILSDIMSSLRDKETKSEIVMEKEPSMESQEEVDTGPKGKVDSVLYAP